MIKIRLAKADEAQLLVDIYVREGLLDEAKIVKEIAQKEFSQIPKERIVWFAEQRACIVGSVQLVLHCKDPKIGLMHHMRVTRDKQGEGIGSLLWKSVLAEARKRNIQTLYLEVERENTHAQMIYKHWGFLHVAQGRTPEELMYKRVL